MVNRWHNSGYLYMVLPASDTRRTVWTPLREKPENLNTAKKNIRQKIRRISEAMIRSVGRPVSAVTLFEIISLPPCLFPNWCSLLAKENALNSSISNICIVESRTDVASHTHKDGEAYYWLLYYTYLTPQQPQNAYEIIDRLRPHIRDISYSTYFRRRQDAIEALGFILWGYTSKDSIELLEQFFPSAK